jgi:hypothetical protein
MAASALSIGILLGQLGPPATQLRTLRHLGDAFTNYCEPLK